MTQDLTTYFVWIGGSCDYGHKERAGGAAVVIEQNGKIISKDVIADLHTTEFRMSCQKVLTYYSLPMLHTFRTLTKHQPQSLRIQT